VNISGCSDTQIARLLKAATEHAVAKNITVDSEPEMHSFETGAHLDPAAAAAAGAGPVTVTICELLPTQPWHVLPFCIDGETKELQRPMLAWHGSYDIEGTKEQNLRLLQRQPKDSGTLYTLEPGGAAAVQAKMSYRSVTKMNVPHETHEAGLFLITGRIACHIKLCENGGSQVPVAREVKGTKKQKTVEDSCPSTTATDDSKDLYSIVASVKVQYVARNKVCDDEAPSKHWRKVTGSNEEHFTDKLLGSVALYTFDGAVTGADNRRVTLAGLYKHQAADGPAGMHD